MSSINTNNKQSSGVVRKIDDLGRVSIPKELRKQYQWQHNDEVELFINGDELILRKVEPKKTVVEELGEMLATILEEQVGFECVVVSIKEVVGCTLCTSTESSLIGKQLSPFFTTFMQKNYKEAWSLHTKIPKPLSIDFEVEHYFPITNPANHDEVIGAVLVADDDDMDEMEAEAMLAAIRTSVKLLSYMQSIK